MKRFLKKVSEWGIVGILVTLGLSSAGVDLATSKTVGSVAEEASDRAIERHTED